MKEKEQLKEENISYGHWSINGAFLLDIPWDDIAEDEGVGRGPEDTFQEEMAERIAENGGAMVIGRRGTGKSHLIKLLKPKLEKQGFKVMCIAFTHVAVANLNGVECDAHTILHLLHNFVGSKRCKHKKAIILDELSMIPMSMWSALMNMKFLGHYIYMSLATTKVNSRPLKTAIVNNSGKIVEQSVHARHMPRLAHQAQ